MRIEEGLPTITPRDVLQEGHLVDWTRKRDSWDILDKMGHPFLSYDVFFIFRPLGKIGFTSAAGVRGHVAASRRLNLDNCGEV